MAGVLRGTQLAQRLAPRAARASALAQRSRGFAAGASCVRWRAACALTLCAALRVQTTTARRR